MKIKKCSMLKLGSLDWNVPCRSQETKSHQAAKWIEMSRTFNKSTRTCQAWAGAAAGAEPSLATFEAPRSFIPQQIAQIHPTINTDDRMWAIPTRTVEVVPLPTQAARSVPTPGKKMLRMRTTKASD